MPVISARLVTKTSLPVLSGRLSCRLSGRTLSPTPFACLALLVSDVANLLVPMGYGLEMSYMALAADLLLRANAKMKRGMHRAKGLVPIHMSRWVGLLVDEPFSRTFGLDRGQPLDRIFIERFLETHAKSIAGDVLEVGGTGYATRFGGPRIRQAHALFPMKCAEADIIGDLTRLESLPSSCYDVVIATQTLPFIFDLPSAVRGIQHLLRPGGRVFITVPGISQISTYDDSRWGDYWRFTPRSVGALFSNGFVDISVTTYGNVATAMGFLLGLCAEEFPRALLHKTDPAYPMIITLCARKPS